MNGSLYIAVNMKTFFIFLATVALHLNVLYAEDVEDFLRGREIVIERQRACKQPVNLRPIFDNFHNTLRQKVAGGIPINYQYFQKRLMYGLIYDCLMEKDADKAVRNPNALIDLPVVRFSTEYGGDKGRLPNAVENGFEDLIVKDKKALIQMIYPKATRFACARTVKRGSPGYSRIDVACVYDKKAELTAFDGKGPCSKDEDCTYFGGKCQWHLCYVPLKYQ
ncbi:hypothetical protein ANCCAN_08842 [Ancylostoma caninum]|uniref:SCP domain-containing protein n=1 Tax=Ancylostoma caninum TaxID=29170 RepID=A0A368GQ55_ANCCA|nr:hypothetical protein ANCCAN_08842 [Ancylostoma caninum]